MSGATTIAAIAAVVGTAYSIYNGQQQAAAQSDAQKEAKANAKKQEAASDMANNRARQKGANSNAILDAAQQAGKSGASGTMLTGPQGAGMPGGALGNTTLMGS